MTYSVAQAPPFTDNVIWYGSACSLGLLHEGVLNALVSVVWPTANKAIYIPFVLQQARTVYQVGWVNGSGAQSGTREVGVYDAGGTKIISGAATPGTVSVAQFVNVTDTLLAPGQYWLAATDAGVISWFAGQPTAPACASLGVLTQTSAQPLPATATFALDNTLAYLPSAFLQLRSVM